jgi:hypothetical protein
MKRYLQDNNMYVKIICADFYALRCYAQVDEEGDFLVSHPQRGLGTVDVRRMSREQQQQQYLKQKMEEQRAAKANKPRASIQLSFAGRRNSQTNRRASRNSRNLSDIDLSLSDGATSGYGSSDGEVAPLNGGSPKKKPPRKLSLLRH